jgi:hypothetical protein
MNALYIAMVIMLVAVFVMPEAHNEHRTLTSTRQMVGMMLMLTAGILLGQAFFV